jgi:hypothetical protein
VGKISQIKTSGEHFGLNGDDRRAGDPVRACEVCGAEGASSDMINVIVCIGSPGHYSLDPFQHPETEHWACNVEHWEQLAHRVVTEMRGHLEEKHRLTEESIHHHA